MVYAIVPAAGQGRRMLAAGGKRKQFMPLGVSTVLETALAALWRSGRLQGIVVVVPEPDVGDVQAQLAGLPFARHVTVVAGGHERQISVQRGLEAVPPEADIVVVHDGARPLVSPELVGRVIDAARTCGAAIAAVPVTDTVKRVNQSGRVIETLDRRELWAVQTPQAFATHVLQSAHEWAEAAGYVATDDAALVESLSFPPVVVEGDPHNIKITRPEDIEFARYLIEHKERQPLRVGIGYDVHRFDPARPLILGGIEIPHKAGLAGHSDADVLLHAISDALLGAAALGDIGKHFPDTDPAYQGASSVALLQEVVRLLGETGWEVQQIDSVVAAQRPRLAPHIEAMRASIAKALGVDVAQVGVKATTTEKKKER